MAGDVIVLKFGSSVLRLAADLPTAVHEIYRWYRAGWRVVAVVSAIGNTTEALLAEARSLASEPEPHATAELLATGERHAAALLGIALDRAGVRSCVVDPSRIALTVSGSALDSQPIHVNSESIGRLLDEFPVMVVPGFFGHGADGQLRLLGRGGSDLTAVYLATTVGANRCRLLKDVDGVYEHDPATASTPPRRFVAMGYADAIERAAALVQPKAVQLLERKSGYVEVAGLLQPHESTIGRFASSLVEPLQAAPTSVLLLGLGTVGFGVYQRILAMPEHLRLAGVLVRDRAKHTAKGVPDRILHESSDDVADLPADVVVDASSGLEPSCALVRKYLGRRIDVVSANKTLIDEAGHELGAVAARSGANFLYSAAVGGSAPMIETLRRERARGEIQCIAGILNGTCNYVLDRCAEGLLLNEAAREAHERGFAEADPAEDLSGNDAARKLRILARHAFGQEIGGLCCEMLNSARILSMRSTMRVTETLRFVARAWKLRSQVFGQIQLEAVDAHDVFAQTRGEWNRLVITRSTGEDIVVHGRGAGRWPTTEAIVADLLEARFARLAHPNLRS